MLRILLLAVCFHLGGTWSLKTNLKGCFNETELKEQSGKLLKRYLGRSHIRMPQAPRAWHLEDHQTKHACSDFQLKPSSTDYSDRATSPWQYKYSYDENRYPQKIVEAECLCEGCIINGVENMTFNSVPVTQNLLVLEKMKCPLNNKKYSFRVAWRKVTIACVCVIPRE